MISIAKPFITSEEIAAVTRVLRSKHLAQGREVKLLEEEFAKLCKVKFAVATNNGTSALHTALYASGIDRGDEVITTSFTFAATANAILMVGAKPIFADIDIKSFNIDPFEIEKKITARTKAIIAVNLYGQPAYYSQIRSIAKKYKLIVIEDAAQSVGATYKNKTSGGLGDIGCFSFYATKNITSGEGGMVVTNNYNYYKKARMFRNQGQTEGKRYFYKDIGYNYRLTDFQAALLMAQLKKLPKIIKKRQEIAKKYTNAFEKIPDLKPPFCIPFTTHVFHQYTLTVSPQSPMSRERLRKYLIKKGIEVVVYYPKALHHFKHFSVNPVLVLKRADSAAQSVLSIPIHPLLTTNEIRYIIQTIQNAYEFK